MPGENYDWAAAKKRIFDRLGIDENTDPYDLSTWSDKLKSVHASHYEANKQNPDFDEQKDYYKEYLPRNISGGSPAPATPAIESTPDVASTPETPVKTDTEKPSTRQLGSFQVFPITDPTGKVVGHHSMHINEGGNVVASFGPYALGEDESPEEAQTKWTNFFAKKHAQMNIDNPEIMAQATDQKKGTISSKTVTNAAMYAKLKSTIEDQSDEEPEDDVSRETSDRPARVPAEAWDSATDKQKELVRDYESKHDAFVTTHKKPGEEYKLPSSLGDQADLYEAEGKLHQSFGWKFNGHVQNQRNFDAESKTHALLGGFEMARPPKPLNPTAAQPSARDLSDSEDDDYEEETPQSVNTAHNVSQQMAGSVSVTPTDAAPAANQDDSASMDDYWKSIADDYRDGYRGGKGREATAAKKRLSKYPIFKHFDDLLKAKNALGIPSDKLGPVENGDVSDVRPGEARSAGKQFATISPEDNDEYTARATRHNEIAKALANLSGHFVGLMNKKEELPTTLAPEHDYSELLGPVKDSSGVINLKSDLGDGPFDYGVVNEYRYGKGTFGYEISPMDAPIRPMTTAGKTSAGLGASQKRAPAKKTPAGVSKFATPDNNPSPSYKVKTTLTSFDPEHFTNRRKDRPQTVVLAHKKAFLMSKMNEAHPLPTEQERAGMSPAQHQSVVDQVFKNRTAWLKKSMESNIDHMLPSKDSNA
jgi:hypothetical protein